MNSPLIQAEMQGMGRLIWLISIGMAAAFFLMTVLSISMDSGIGSFIWILFFNDHLVHDHAAYANQDGNFGESEICY